MHTSRPTIAHELGSNTDPRHLSEYLSPTMTVKDTKVRIYPSAWVAKRLLSSSHSFIASMCCSEIFLWMPGHSSDLTEEVARGHDGQGQRGGLNRWREQMVAVQSEKIASLAFQGGCQDVGVLLCGQRDTFGQALL